MTHESRLQQSLRALLVSRRTAALAVQAVSDFAQLAALPAPLLSFVPWAWDSRFSCIVLHVSALAGHTQAMTMHPAVSLLMTADEVAGQGVHALERVSIQGVASTPDQDSVLWQGARSSYLERFPEAEPMMALGDFRFVCITPSLARHVAGFGAARHVSAHDLIEALNPAKAE
ncbi:MAG: pyridoxamine 5'-phosphate oxidase [Comamonas sp.]